ncbi:hypothetical protein BKA69DRAFT_1079591 [Paraphysoderma sedebokerense]|nr:hypothetical protein BKA69DRAFT_1079591 [Paraphysoderma sedebokerense]
MSFLDTELLRLLEAYKEEDNLSREEKLQLLLLLLRFANNLRNKSSDNNTPPSSTEPLPPTGPPAALPPPPPSMSQSPWQHLYDNGSDEELIHAIGFNRRGFELLLKPFSKYYQSGRSLKSKEEKHVGLAIILTYYVWDTHHGPIGDMFCIPTWKVSQIITKTELALSKALEELPEAKIKWPDFDQQKEWAELVQSWEPVVEKTWGFIDGQTFYIHGPVGNDLKNAQKNRWFRADVISNVACFGADGSIVWARLNSPVVWNDEENFCRFIAKLGNPEKSLLNYGVVADSDFPVDESMIERIVTPATRCEILEAAPRLQPWLIKKSNAISTVQRRIGEGMFTISQIFRRLCSPLPFNPYLRQRRLKNIYLLYNVRVRTGLTRPN